MPLRLLTLPETRVLGVLVEKERTVADIYPLSLNALVAGCNQKNNRHPVLALADAEVQQAIDALKALSLVIESSGARVPRNSHNTGPELRVPDQPVAQLAVLMLRGPQTAGELRINSERLHRFADISSVEAFLEELATRPGEQGGPLVQLLPRRPGEREQRWAHLLSGEVAVDAAPEPAAVSAQAPAGEHAEMHAELRAELQQQIDALRAEVAELRAEVRRLGATPGSSAGTAAD
jgi:uncharacterized protein YceH (UPF0502 family)